ncbi:hypothetical protein KDW_62620 [Dictyobacter vulcani]|uniref:UPF0261 domain-containing protein n=1 Tax=Dictyobacter vulcani TaxID=2607529 RepID=A0A5J4KZX4_9CHLR|nr:Tm-1-like ATP-binding domain-containing protein [Dictyobacter vulcani]GER92100.1 hypothetical protein KDW_62620 [Dictyobacter vulcani]
MTTVVLLGTLDTRGSEYAYVRERIVAQGCRVLLVDAGIKGDPSIQPDITREVVARAARIDVAQLASVDQNTAIALMAKGVTATIVEQFARGRLHGILGLGGDGGSRLATAAMRSLPLGVPKLLVSPLASGDVRPFVGATDISVMYSVAEIHGINAITECILTNAAACIAAMAQAYNTFELSPRARLHPYLIHQIPTRTLIQPH